MAMAGYHNDKLQNDWNSQRVKQVKQQRHFYIGMLSMMHTWKSKYFYSDTLSRRLCFTILTYSYLQIFQVLLAVGIMLWLRIRFIGFKKSYTEIVLSLT
jgi:hypothetical protein